MDEPAAHDALARAAVQVVEDEPPAVRRSVRNFGGLRAPFYFSINITTLIRLPRNSQRKASETRWKLVGFLRYNSCSSVRMGRCFFAKWPAPSWNPEN